MVSVVGAWALAGRPVGMVGYCWWICGGRSFDEVARAWPPGHVVSWDGCGQWQERQGCWNLGIHWVGMLCLWATGTGQCPPPGSRAWTNQTNGNPNLHCYHLLIHQSQASFTPSS